MIVWTEKPVKIRQILIIAKYRRGKEGCENIILGIVNLLQSLKNTKALSSSIVVRWYSL